MARGWFSVVCRLGPMVMSLAVVACLPVDDPGDDDSETEAPTMAPEDADGDGFSVKDDCDDSNAAFNPDADEVCDALDNDCNGQADDGLVVYTYYQDEDSDGYGNPVAQARGCEQPEGYVVNNQDCSDSNTSVHPGTTEVCNGIDDDCDNAVDDLLMVTYYLDADGDGFALDGTTATTSTCDGPPSGYTLYFGDCDDTNASISPLLVDAVNGSASGTGASSSPFLSIQSAIDAVAACPVVLVAKGTYGESVEIEEQSGITLKSIDGAESVLLTIDTGERPLLIANSDHITVEGIRFVADTDVFGSGAGILIYESSDILLDGVVIENSATTGDSQSGGGLGVTDSERITVRGCTLRNNHSAYGGGIGINAATVTVEDSLIEDNVADEIGGGVVIGDASLEGEAHLTMTGCTVRNNTASIQGGGVFVQLEYTAEFEDSVFEENRVTSTFYMGGGIYNPTVVKGCAFIKNSASFGGGVYIRAFSEISNSIFWQNSAPQGGGAVHINDGSEYQGYIELVNNTMVDNKCSLGLGSSLYLFDADMLVVRNNIMADFVSSADNLYSVESNAEVSLFDHNDVYSPSGDLTGMQFSDQMLVENDNIVANPTFVYYDDSSFTDSDFHLSSGSPCVDAGNPDAGIDRDGSSNDMGAYGGPAPYDL